MVTTDLRHFPGGLFRVGGGYQDASGKPIPEDRLPEALRPKPEGPKDPEGCDLPKDLAGRADLIKQGVLTIAAVREKGLDGLVALDGIGKATAERILAHPQVKA